ncbi:MAG: hypothetical protein OEM26_19100 [Saprospiraceae bacterium]|nr:hypothetical protein [Saprospiraceae bacterium]
MWLGRFLASIVIILMHLPLIACSCILIESFCEAVNLGKEWSPQMTMAIRGVKVKDVPVDDYRTDMIFQITESYYNPMALTTVRVLVETESVVPGLYTSMELERNWYSTCGCVWTRLN